MIAVPIVASTIKEAKKDIEKASKSADIIELRLDYIKDLRLENLLGRRIRKPVIITDRKKSEGGKFRGSEKKRVEILKDSLKYNPDFVDIELSSRKKAINQIKKLKDKKTRLIISYHNFNGTPKNLVNIYKKIRKLNPDIIKIVGFAKSIDDNIKIFNLLKKAKKDNKKIIAFCMGEKGEISRILSPIFGGFLTFGSFKKGKESAQGQITVNVLKNIYNINNKNNKTKIYGLVGNPVDRSKGYIFHNKLFQKYKLNGIYVNFLVDSLSSFVKNYKNYFSGLSITMPFKKNIIGCLDKLDRNANKIGAVNTVIKKGNKLIGYNTDMAGAIKSIEKKILIKDKKILLIGAGGVAKAIAFGVKSKRGNLIISNRTIKKGKSLANKLGCKFIPLNKIKSLKNIDIIINGTSIGMYPKTSITPINKNILKKIKSKKAIVFDSVYNPEKTKFLKEAKSIGCKIVGGSELFVNQALEQFKLFTDKNIGN